MAPSSILVVDDESGIRSSLQAILREEGWQADAVATGEECVKASAKKSYDLILLDVWLPGMDGLEALRRLKERDPAPIVIMISGHATIETAVKATKLGAFDFIEKPLSMEKTVLAVRHALDQLRLAEENRELRNQLRARYRIIGESIPIKALRQQLALTAPTNSRILIYGASGTGKELVARALHAGSLRAGQPFVEVNCAAIPEELIESELFGHQKGAFTGASEDKTGKFQKADTGTLFLDEVGDMSLRTQSKVLRVLEDYFLGEYATAYGRRKKRLAPEVLEVFAGYAWPGNVRELKNVIERLVIMVPGERLETRHLPPELFRESRRPLAEAATLQEARTDTEREFILRKLEENRWNVSRTAAAVGLERSHLHRKMKALGLSPRNTRRKR